MGGGGASRSVEEGAASVLWAARLGPDGPTGGFFRDGQPGALVRVMDDPYAVLGVDRAPRRTSSRPPIASRPSGGTRIATADEESERRMAQVNAAYDLCGPAAGPSPPSARPDAAERAGARARAWSRHRAAALGRELLEALDHGEEVH